MVLNVLEIDADASAVEHHACVNTRSVKSSENTLSSAASEDALFILYAFGICALEWGCRTHGFAEVRL